MAPFPLDSSHGLQSLAHLFDTMIEWLSQPRFGPVGIGAGTLAAAFQSYMYGAFTPAGGIFATLTSMAMLGTLMPAAAILAAVIATGAAIIVWVLGIGRP
ncbi:hypothetical protein TrVGV298_007866 [Trichoderma virens]|nr:hypothetical protein TrVGV298_007866 [Trichoderma virens]